MSRDNPPRLVEGSDPVGRLLARGQRESEPELDEPGAFRRLEGRRRARSRAALGGAMGVLAGALLLVTAGPALREPSELAVTREPVAGPAPLAVEPPAEPRHAVPPALAPPPELDPIEPKQATRAALPPSNPPSEDSCRELAQSQKPERAADCYRVLSRGSGVGAEVALYEAARLSAERLGDPERALGLLGEYGERFPKGALRAEAEWLRVKTLSAAGRTDAALAASEALLETPSGRALSADIHWLRARLFQDGRRDCSKALSELVALVGEPGARGDEAELRRARCLEELGRKADAQAAYEQYLRRQNPRDPATARARARQLAESVGREAEIPQQMESNER